MSHNVYTITSEPERPAKSVPPRQRPRLSPLAATLIGVVLTATAAVLIWHYWPEKLPPATAEPIVLAKFVGTEQFARLPQEKKEEYIRPLMSNVPGLFEAVRTGKLSMEEARRGMENGGVIAFGMHAANYLAEPTQQARDAYLDRLIDEQERVRALPFFMRPRQNASGAGQPEGPHRGMTDPATMKSRIENIDPLTRARIAEFMGSMRKRRVERGLPATPGH